MRIPNSTTFGVLLSASLALTACSESTKPASTPAGSTTSNTSGVVTTTGPAQPGDPGGADPTVRGTKPESGGPASPLEGSCERGDPSRAAKDLGSCQKSCKGLNDQVPLGSSCASAVDQCLAKCGTVFAP